MEIHLSPERQAQLNDYANRHGQDPATALDHVLGAALEWEQQDYQEAVEGIGRGYTDFQAGRVRPIEESFEDLREKHGLIGDVPVDSLGAWGSAWYEFSKEFAKSLTAEQPELAELGIDATTLPHQIFDPQRNRGLEYVGVKSKKNANGQRIPTGRPSFPSRRDPVTSLTGSSSAKNAGGLTVDLVAKTFTWKAAGALQLDKKTGKFAPKGRLKFPITARMRFPRNDPWLREAIRFPIAQVRVLHRQLGNKRRWYVQLILEGIPPIDPALRSTIAKRVAGAVGVDIGSRHIAAAGADSALLADLAPTMIAREAARDGRVVNERDGDRRKKDRWYRRLQRRMAQARSRNPENIDKIKTRPKTLVKTRDGKAVGKVVEVPAGFKKRARLKISKRVEQQNNRLVERARADTAARVCDHGRLVNAIATMGDEIKLEKLSYVGWQKSFGRQVRRHAPGSFEALIRRRAAPLGLSVSAINTQSTKLSQVCHACGGMFPTAIRGPIATRMKPACECGREAVHRDGYSSWLARYASESSVDRQALSGDWTGARMLLAGALLMYDTAEDPRIPRVFRATEIPSFCAAAPQAQVAGFPAAPVFSIDGMHSHPATVRERVQRKHGAKKPGISTTAQAAGGSTDHNDRQCDERRHDDETRRGRSTLTGRGSPAQMSLGLGVAADTTTRRSKSASGGSA